MEPLVDGRTVASAQTTCQSASKRLEPYPRVSGRWEAEASDDVAGEDVAGEYLTGEDVTDDDAADKRE